jgi:hypothetical protein
MAEITIHEDDEMLKKIFVEEFVRDNLTYDWKHIDKIVNGIKERLVEEKLKENIKTSGESSNDDSSGGEMY